MLWLLGPAERVDAHLDYVDRPEGRTDAGFVVNIAHRSGVYSSVSPSIERLPEQGQPPRGTTAAGVRQLGRRSGGRCGRAGTDSVRGDAAPRRSRRVGLRTTGTVGRPPHRRGRGNGPAATGCVSGLLHGIHDRRCRNGEQPVPARTALGTIAVLEAAREAAGIGGTVVVRSAD
ncbi:hypothetical protein [Rhodococcus opacus]|uniref:hypothetical protein n=1 Tax=Rhodococcus opacus TaxID=37919 RepID=UPI00352F3876